MSVVHFKHRDIAVNLESDEPLIEAIRRAGLNLETPCDGTGTCGKCRIKVQPASSILHTASEFISADDLANGWTLACQARANADVTIELDEAQTDSLQILSEGHESSVTLRPWIKKSFDPASNSTTVQGKGTILSSEPSDTTRALFGLSIDIGTTTLVTALIDLRTGKELGSTSSLNPQARRAQDVLSRIKLGSQPEGLSLLQQELIAELNQQISQLASSFGIKTSDIWEAVFSGNTTMLHLAAGANPASLGKFPYVPALRGGTHTTAAELNLSIAQRGLIYLPPIMSAYVGADITSGILATRLHEHPGVVLFVDIGTNGEMVLSVDGQLTATSTAAGPAFEGMNIACGMRASRGAIERVTLQDGTVNIQTIDNAPPSGICGSGLLDAVGELAAKKGIDANGRFQTKDSAWPWRDRWDLVDNKPVFRLAGQVYLSQKDIRQVQLAKAAVRAGIDLLLNANSLTPSRVDRILIAGSFGYHLRENSLIDLGLLPREFKDRVHFVGNTSKSGGKAFLLDRETRREMSAVTSQVRVLELANDPAFERTFIRSLSF